MDDNKALKNIYTFFLGLLIAIFIGTGVNTFYSGPKAPEWPTESNTYGKEPTEEQLKVQKEFDKKNEQYNKESKPYSRNVSIITMAAALILLTLSLLYEKKVKLIADGVMLGGLFTLIYSLARGFASENSKYIFILVSVGLAVVLYMGYHRFVREPKAAKK